MEKLMLLTKKDRAERAERLHISIEEMERKDKEINKRRRAYNKMVEQESSGATKPESTGGPWTQPESRKISAPTLVGEIRTDLSVEERIALHRKATAINIPVEDTESEPDTEERERRERRRFSLIINGEKCILKVNDGNGLVEMYGCPRISLIPLNTISEELYRDIVYYTERQVARALWTIYDRCGETNILNLWYLSNRDMSTEKTEKYIESVYQRAEELGEETDDRIKKYHKYRIVKHELIARATAGELGEEYNCTAAQLVELLRVSREEGKEKRAILSYMREKERAGERAHYSREYRRRIIELAKAKKREDIPVTIGIGKSAVLYWTREIAIELLSVRLAEIERICEDKGLRLRDEYRTERRREEIPYYSTDELTETGRAVQDAVWYDNADMIAELRSAGKERMLNAYACGLIQSSEDIEKYSWIAYGAINKELASARKSLRKHISIDKRTQGEDGETDKLVVDRELYKRESREPESYEQIINSSVWDCVKTYLMDVLSDTPRKSRIARDMISVYEERRRYGAPVEHLMKEYGRSKASIERWIAECAELAGDMDRATLGLEYSRTELYSEKHSNTRRVGVLNHDSSESLEETRERYSSAYKPESSPKTYWSFDNSVIYPVRDHELRSVSRAQSRAYHTAF